jgi:hypothetical protein
MKRSAMVCFLLDLGSPRLAPNLFETTEYANVRARHTGRESWDAGRTSWSRPPVGLPPGPRRFIFSLRRTVTQMGFKRDRGRVQRATLAMAARRAPH